MWGAPQPAEFAPSGMERGGYSTSISGTGASLASFDSFHHRFCQHPLPMDAPVDVPGIPYHHGAKRKTSAGIPATTVVIRTAARISQRKERISQSQRIGGAGCGGGGTGQGG